MSCVVLSNPWNTRLSFSSFSLYVGFQPLSFMNTSYDACMYPTKALSNLQRKEKSKATQLGTMYIHFLHIAELSSVIETVAVNFGKS